jgi:hypothetical protein
LVGFCCAKIAVIARKGKSSLTSRPDSFLPSGNQKRFWRDPVKRAERFNAFLSRVA